MSAVIAADSTISATLAGRDRSGGVDLLRGLSVIAVILLHINIRIPFTASALGARLPRTAVLVTFWSGYYGVVTFFVISGFLITTLSVKRWQTLPAVAIGPFYRMRFARIAPCLILLLAVLSILQLERVPGFVIDPTRTSLPVALLAALTFRINVLQAHVGDLPACWNVLWTLSIEEVFYLAFPLVCRLARSERNMILLLSAVIVAGPIARVVGPHNTDAQDQTYLCCMDGIAFGCLAALLARRIRWQRPALVTVFTVGLAAAIFIDVFRKPVYDLGLVSTGLYVTVLEIGVALMLIGIQNGLDVGSSAPPTAAVQFFGRNSYEIYLVHSFVVVGLTQLYRAYDWGAGSIPIWYAAILVLSGLLGFLLARLYSAPLNRRLRGTILPKRPAHGL